jgi:multidrug transporter EmrE-like cation transporter
MLIVLLAALLHAAWNAFIKSGDNKFVETTLLVTSAGAIAAVVLPFVPGPARASWPFLGASVAIHCVYFSLVALAYRTGELSFAYPLMRGSAPLFTAVLTVSFVGEPIGGGGWLGILLLCAGILAHGRLEIGQQPARRLYSKTVVIVAHDQDGLGSQVSCNA